MTPDAKEADRRFSEALARIHDADALGSIGGHVDSRRDEMLAMFDAYLGPDFDEEIREAVLDLQGKLHRFQCHAVNALEAGVLSPEEYVDKFNRVLRLVFESCEARLGSQNFRMLFGAPPAEMHGFIDKATFLQERGVAGLPTKAPDQPFLDLSTRALTVLVVDDSQLFRATFRSTLEGEGYTVVVAEDGWHALGELSSIKPDVMLVDVVMPRMDGFELVNVIQSRNETRSLPIVMVSADATPERQIFAASMGTTLLSKEASPEVLLHEIRGSLAAATRVH